MTDRRRAWAVAMAVFIAGIAVAANRFKVPPVLPVLMEELGVDMVTAGWLMSSSSVAGVLLAVPTALLLARLGLKLMGLVAMGCTVAGAVTGALAGDATTMLIGRIIEGIGVGVIAVLAPTAISLWFPPRVRGLPMGIWATWVPVGNVIMFNIAQPLTDHLGWQATWWFGVTMGAVAFVLVALVVRNPDAASPDRQSTSAPAGGAPSGTHGDRAAPELPVSLWWLLSNRSTLLLTLAFGSFGFSLLGYNTWAPTFLRETLSLKAGTANTYASLMFMAAIPANVLAGWVLSRMKDRTVLLPVTFLITGFLFLWGFRLGSAGVAAVYMICLGFASNFIPTATFTLAPETMPGVEHAGLALAMVMGGSYVGSLLGPPTLGVLVSSGGWQVGSTCMVIVMAIGTTAAWFAARRIRAA